MNNKSIYFSLLVLFFLSSCLEDSNTEETFLNENHADADSTKIEAIQDEFYLKGTTWKTSNGGIIIFSDEEDTFLYGNEEKDKYREGKYSKYGNQYSLKHIGGDWKELGFRSTFGDSPLLISIDDTNPKSFSFTRSSVEKVGGNFKREKETITFTLSK